MDTNQFYYQNWKQMEVNNYSFNHGERVDKNPNYLTKNKEESCFQKIKESAKNLIGKGKETYTKVVNSPLGKAVKKVTPVVNGALNAVSGYEKGEEVAELKTTQADRIHGKDNIRDEAIRTGAQIGGTLGSVLGGLTKLGPYGLFTFVTGYDPITEFTGYLGSEAGARIGEVTAVTTKEVAETTLKVKDTLSGTYDQAINDTAKYMEKGAIFAKETGNTILEFADCNPLAGVGHWIASKF